MSVHQLLPGMLLMAGRAAAEMYCPTANDLQLDYNDGGAILLDQGWEITDSARVSTKASFNLLGGYVEFTMDVSETNPGVNTNLYSSFPNLTSAGYRGTVDYCDGQGPNEASPYWCLEQDYIETNGPMLFASTWHTVEKDASVGDLKGCDHHGCGAEHHFLTALGCNRSSSHPEPVIDSSRPFQLRASFSESGEMSILLTQDDVKLQVAEFSHWDGGQPDDDDYQIIKSYMENQGAVILSSQWTGWVPGNECPLGSSGADSTNGSKFAIYDLTLSGKLLRGNATKCPDADKHDEMSTSLHVGPTDEMSTSPHAGPTWLILLLVWSSRSALAYVL